MPEGHGSQLLPGSGGMVMYSDPERGLGLARWVQEYVFENLRSLKYAVSCILIPLWGKIYTLPLKVGEMIM